MALSKKLPKQWRKSLSSKYLFLTLLLNKKNKNEYTRYQDMVGQVYSKHGSPTFLLVWAMELSIISTCFGKGKVFF